MEKDFDELSEEQLMNVYDAKNFELAQKLALEHPELYREKSIAELLDDSTQLPNEEEIQEGRSR